ncbi:hypothetical protein [Dongia sp.]|uniref:hypothetical protein n=1 Tax=Dongia sp. TaxID=1977262 RepID=UPI0035AEF385
MSSTLPIDDIVAWSQKLPDWQRDALRRLACNGQLSPDDRAELLAMVKQRAGLLTPKVPALPVPFDKSHHAGAIGGSPLALLGVRNVQNVNRLASHPFHSHATKYNSQLS